MLFSIVCILNLLSFMAASIFPESRIVGGVMATTNLFPFMAFLKGNHLEKGSWKDRVCAGSIISNIYILTAAHCTTEEDSVQVSIGSNQFKEKSSFFVYYTHIIVHPDFDFSHLNNDISILMTPLMLLSDSIKTIRLPYITQKYSENSYMGDNVYIAGWGCTAFASEPNSENCTRSVNLNYVMQKVISNEECVKYNVKFTKNQICVSTEGHKYPSYGDSGGSLILPSPAQDPILIGVLSNGYPKESHEGAPVTYTRVTSYLTWIQEHTKIAYLK